jgi:predicted ferric reductase
MTNRAGPFLSPPARLILGIVIIALGVALLTGTSTIALRTHSREVAEYGGATAWLFTAGKIFGLLAGTLVLLQFALSAKLKAMDRVFGLHRLLSAHRVLGVSAAVLASLHPLFLFAPQAKEIGGFRFDIWPELLGVALLIGLWTAVCTGLWREFLGLPYERWYLFHRLGTFCAAALVAIHALNVSPDFEGDWPLYALVVVLGLYVALFLWEKGFKRGILKKRMYTVTSVTPAGRATYAVEVAPATGQIFPYAPGQFAFVTFYSEALPLERHPWTISSTPTRPKSLIFTIKCSGDFTASISRLQSGDRAVVDGPYGLFSYHAYVHDPHEELVMVAGGVGVTPMLSMLRYMVDAGDDRKTTLVWSNKTEADIVCREEFDGMRAKLSSLSIHYVLTGQEDFNGPTGRLDGPMLTELLSGCSREASVFVCGPPPMMDAICMALKGIGFRPRRIHTERFSI